MILGLLFTTLAIVDWGPTLHQPAAATKPLALTAARRLELLSDTGRP